MNLTFTAPKALNNLIYTLIGVGVLATIGAFVVDGTDPHGVAAGEWHHMRFWANFLIDSFFFMSISLAALFFLALQYAAEVGWSVSIKRVIEAITAYLPFGLIFMAIVFVTGYAHIHHLYHWMDAETVNPESPKYDAIIAGKQGYFGWFWWLRTALYIGLWIMFQVGFRKRSLQADLEEGNGTHWKNFKKGATFLVIFAVSSSTSSWDWLMSLDVHWFSTMYGWYTFAGMWCSAMIVAVLLISYLKKLGYLEFVTESTVHDISKWMFATSFLWTYLYFSQFMLIWYADIPEEVTYFQTRFENYKPLMWFVLFTNFALPMILLMSRDAKRNFYFITLVGGIIFIGHWLDVFMMVMPGTVGHNLGFGWQEIGMFCMFLGLFMLVVFRALAKAPLLVKNHPYLNESIHHTT